MVKKRISSSSSASPQPSQKKARYTINEDLDDFQPQLYISTSSSSPSSSTTHSRSTRASHAVKNKANEDLDDDFQPQSHMSRSSSSTSSSSAVPLDATKIRGLNHFPLSIFNNYKGNLSAIALIGLFGADGVNSSKTNYLGFAFQSIAFPHLYSILKKCGVQQPRLKFTIDGDLVARQCETPGYGQMGFPRQARQGGQNKVGAAQQQHIYDTDVPQDKTSLRKHHKLPTKEGQTYQA